MKGSKVATAVLVAVGGAALIAYDVWAAAAHGYDYTITAMIRGLAQKMPIIPAAVGLIFGYWLGLAKSLDDKEEKP